MTTLEHKLAEGFIHEMMKHAADPVVPTGPIPTTPVKKNWLQEKGQQVGDWAMGHIGNFVENNADSITGAMGKDRMGRIGKKYFEQNPGQAAEALGSFAGSDQGQRIMINKGVSENLRGLLKTGPGGISINPAGIPGAIGGWIKNNPGTAMLGAGGLLGGGMLLSSMFSGNNNNQQQGQPQSITPQGYQPPKTTFNKFSVANDEDIRQYVLNSIYDSN